MYDDYEGPVSFYGVLKGVVGIAIIGTLIYMGTLVIDKLREKKFRFTIIDSLKFIWMIVSVIISIYMINLVYSSDSIDEANRKFEELLPFKRGILGAVTSFVASIFIFMFCMLGIGTFFEKSKKIDKNQNNTKPNS